MNKMVKKLLTVKQLKDYLNKNDIVLIKTTINFSAIPKGTKIFIGRNERNLTTYDNYTNSKNMNFDYKFNYRWSTAWDDYKGKFELIDEQKEEIDNKIKELEKLGYEVKKKKIKYPITIITKEGHVKIYKNGEIAILNHMGERESVISQYELEEFKDKVIPKAIEIRDSKD